MSHLIFKHWESGHRSPNVNTKDHVQQGIVRGQSFLSPPMDSQARMGKQVSPESARAPSWFWLRDGVQALLSICQPVGGGSQSISSGPAQMDSHFLRCRETQMGRRATKRAFLAQPSRITWDLGIPLEFLPAPHLSPHHLLLLPSLFSLSFNSPLTIFTEAPWLLWKPNATKEAEFGGVLRFPAQ